ncbi:uncharacterized protein LOC131249384 [Magnolia sinica]|uniref:uncharacterized protein LOC131249384 n=1 Tax=Magnolia sinica TaxID=86752 RepID=UPI0026582030|nr:uncharacterized protein LOC131249384 [Magnolia sinica]XP_058106117.1 uncharacterized protein LOC131249384 [Magnolia sinica]
MEAEAEILQPFLLHFSDLLLLSSPPPTSDEAELKRLESLSRSVMEALGPTGPGLLSIVGVPKASYLRQTLLPFARKLALLSPNALRRVLKDHSLGSDVPLKNPDRRVSSFALQLKYVQDLSSELTSGVSRHNDEDGHIAKEQHPNVNGSHDFHDYEFKNLGRIFKELGICMMELGLRIAQVCDKAIGGQELEQSILNGGTAKGRLIHYHSTIDNVILKQARRGKRFTKGPATHCVSLPCGLTGSEDDIPMNSGTGNGGDKQMAMDGLNLENFENGVVSCRTSLSNLWQQWHYDYAIFTVLTTPMFLYPCCQPTSEAKDGFCILCGRECSPPNGHTYLQIFETNRNKILLVRSPPESFIVQVGESADILSKGKLRSTLHSVCRPVDREELSRETFVVFLQPAWDKTLSISEYPMTSAITGYENLTLDGKVSRVNDEETELDSDVVSTHLADRESHKIVQEILNIVPPLFSRLKDGMTFAEFSRETTKQYYGGNGIQSKR